MTADTALQLAIATLCGLLGALHVALWRLAPRDRVQLWLALALIGAALFALGLAGGSGALGTPAAWLALGTAGNLPGWLGFVAAVWLVTDATITAVRGALFAALAALWLVTAFLHARYLAQADVASWRDMTAGDPGWLGPAVGAALAGTALVEGVLARRVALIAAALATIAIVVGHVTGATGAISVVGLTALPVVLVASATLVQRYRRALVAADRAGEYELEQPLAAGGMGELYRATRLGPAGFRRTVALKRIRARADDASIDRLLAEARTAAALVHPNIVAVHDVGRLDGFGWYIAMELLTGCDVAKLRAGGRLPVEVAVLIGERAARGLAYAHAQGVLHRDVTPHNIVATSDGEVKLVDFGIATANAADDGRLVGKLVYLAPELLAGGGYSEATDQFGLGVTLYELIAGALPFSGGNALELADAQHRGARPLREARPDVPDGVAAIVERAIAIVAVERFPSASALADALAEVARELPPGELARYVREVAPGPTSTPPPREPTAPTRPL